LTKVSYVLTFISLVGAPAYAQSALCGEGPFCQPPTLQSSNVSGKESRFYIGLVWDTSRSARNPDFVIGYRDAKVTSSNDVTGADLSLKVRLEDSALNMDSVRVMALTGSTDLIGTFGAGYSFADDSAILTGGLQHSHLRGSIDYDVGAADFSYFFEVNSLLPPEKPLASGVGCPADTSPVAAVAGQDTSLVLNGSNLTITPQAPQISDGITCVGFLP
jgi:hypothetical protein